MSNQVIHSEVEELFVGDNKGELHSRLLNDRVVFVVGTINEHMANLTVAQLLSLELRSPTGNIDRDFSCHNMMEPEAAKDYGLIDEIADPSLSAAVAMRKQVSLE